VCLLKKDSINKDDKKTVGEVVSGIVI